MFRSMVKYNLNGLAAERPAFGFLFLLNISKSHLNFACFISIFLFIVIKRCVFDIIFRLFANLYFLTFQETI